MKALVLSLLAAAGICLLLMALPVSIHPGGDIRQRAGCGSALAPRLSGADPGCADARSDQRTEAVGFGAPLVLFGLVGAARHALRLRPALA